MKRGSNILITSAGRRVELLKAFQAQRDRILPHGLVHATDTNSEFSAACQLADRNSKSPRASDISYRDFLLEYCAEHSIGLLVPTIDTELEVSAN